MQIENVREYITEKGDAVSDLLNSSGAILVKQGKPVPENIFRMPVYCHSQERQRISLDTPAAEWPASPFIQAIRIPATTEEEERPRFNYLPLDEEVVLHYQTIKGRLRQIFSDEPISMKSYRLAVEIIDETFSTPREGLIRALWLLRSSDRYTCDHSFSVYLLFLEAIDDLRAHRMEDAFYDSLKSLSGKVNFNSTNLKRYAMGALLHDYGKLSIEERIVNKDSALTLGELDLIRLHPYYGVRALKLIGVQDAEILDIVGNHHHNYRVDDVSQSPLAQICNIVDIYDACRAGRSYKDGFPFERTLEVLEQERQRSGWDPFIYRILVSETLVRMENRLTEISAV